MVGASFTGLEVAAERVEVGVRELWFRYATCEYCGAQPGPEPRQVGRVTAQDRTGPLPIVDA